MKKIQVVYALELFGRNSFCEALSTALNYQIVYVKDVLKESLRISKSPLVLTIKEHIHNGEIIPSELLNEFVIKKINDSDANQIIVGYPMQAEQFELFTNSLEKLNIEMTKSWLIDYKDVNFLVKKGMEFKGEVHCKKVNWTFVDEKKLALERLSIFGIRIKKLEENHNLNFDRVDISEINNRMEDYLKLINNSLIN